MEFLMIEARQGKGLNDLYACPFKYSLNQRSFSRSYTV